MGGIFYNVDPRLHRRLACCPWRLNAEERERYATPHAPSAGRRQ